MGKELILTKMIETYLYVKNSRKQFLLIMPNSKY